MASSRDNRVKGTLNNNFCHRCCRPIHICNCPSENEVYMFTLNKDSTRIGYVKEDTLPIKNCLNCKEVPRKNDEHCKCTTCMEYARWEPMIKR